MVEISVLYVEDNLAILDSTSMLLELLGVTVLASPDRTGALAFLQHGLIPDVIVCDYQLANDTGGEVIRTVREALGVAVPAIIMTGDAGRVSLGPETRERTEIINKPPDRGQLEALVRQLAIHR
jgi:CheY-like chemotaxis protein